MKVVILPEVFDYMEDLMEILYRKEYFGFRESASEYVIDLLDNIKANLPKQQHKRAPERFAKYGEDLHYASFVKNKRTTWYAFFTKYENESKDIIYLVRYIANNHTVAHHL